MRRAQKWESCLQHKMALQRKKVKSYRRINNVLLVLRFVFCPLHSYLFFFYLKKNGYFLMSERNEIEKTHDYSGEVFQLGPHGSRPFDDSNIVLVGVRPVRH